MNRVNGRLRRWRTALACPVLALGLGLAGCGWQPLYATPSDGTAAAGPRAKLAQIAIGPIKTESPDPLTGNTAALYDARAAQLVRSYLEGAINPYGPPSTPDYRLAIDLTQDVRSIASRGNGDATRDELVMSATYQLLDRKGHAVLAERATSLTSYDVLDQPFSDLSSSRDAVDRGAQQLAAAIQTRLAVFTDNLP